MIRKNKMSVRTLLWAMICFVSAAVNTGCAGLIANQVPAKTFFTLQTAELGEAACAGQNHDPKAPMLLVADVSASSFLDTQRILFSRVPGTRLSYQYSYWTEPPPRALSAMLADRLKCSASFSQVAPVSLNTRGDLLVKLTLQEFFHDAENAPGYGVVEVLVDLVDVEKRLIVASNVFKRREEASSFDAAGATSALSRASVAVIEDLVNWLEEAPKG